MASVKPLAYSETPSQVRDRLLLGAALAWQERCRVVPLKAGTKVRQGQLEAYLQATLALLTAANLMTFDEADMVGLLVATGRGEEWLARHLPH